LQVSALLYRRRSGETAQLPGKSKLFSFDAIKAIKYIVEVII
jgi:hypothetical protein